MMREENADYTWRFGRTEPTGSSIAYRRYWNKDKYVDFQGEPAPVPGSTNADLIHNLRNHEPVPEAGRTDADLIRNLRDHL